MKLIHNPYLRLMRPANIVTAWADILLGVAASGVLGHHVFGGYHWSDIGWLLLATTGLYGGGVVLNDVFDIEIDRVERPERPLPRGEVSVGSAAVIGVSLLVYGIMAAAQVSWLSAVIAYLVAFLAVLYDARGKHHPLWGPINMGACRGGNLLLGLSILPAAVNNWYLLAFIPIIYIGAITMISRGEVGGGNRQALDRAVALYGIVVVTVLGLGMSPSFSGFQAFPFLALFIGMVFPPLLAARQDLLAMSIRKAVKTGVLSLIILDATLAAGFQGFAYGALVLALLPLSMWLARQFAVT